MHRWITPNLLEIIGGNGAKSVNKLMGKKINEQEIIEYYKSRPMTISEVAQKFNLCNPTVSKILVKNNIEVYSKHRIFNPEFDENYFDTIDSEFKAYILGFLFADGCIFKSPNSNGLSVALQLKESDKIILEKFREEVKSNRILVQSQRDNSYSFTISSTKICEDLIKHNMARIKTNRTNLPKLNDNLFSHFVRGLFDGDGSIIVKVRDKRRNMETKSGYIAFCGSELLLEELQNYLYEHKIVTKKVKIKLEDNIHIMRWGNIDSLRSFYNYIYNSSTVYLERKYTKFTKYLESK